jgi:hypothetical protein
MIPPSMRRLTARDVGATTSHKYGLRNFQLHPLLIESDDLVRPQTQPAGYRDYDQWCRNATTMHKGRAALTSRIHEISPNHSRLRVNAEVLRLYENAEYSRVPVVRVHDSRISWLKSARLFPKAHGVQVMVHLRGEHPPPHIHAEFLNSNKVVKIAWQPLGPMRGEPQLSAREEKHLRSYLEEYQDEMLEKLKKAFNDRICKTLCSALLPGGNSNPRRADYAPVVLPAARAVTKL